MGYLKGAVQTSLPGGRILIFNFQPCQRNVDVSSESFPGQQPESIRDLRPRVTTPLARIRLVQGVRCLGLMTDPIVDRRKNQSIQSLSR